MYGVTCVVRVHVYVCVLCTHLIFGRDKCFIVPTIHGLVICERCVKSWLDDVCRGGCCSTEICLATVSATFLTYCNMFFTHFFIHSHFSRRRRHVYVLLNTCVDVCIYFVIYIYTLTHERRVKEMEWMTLPVCGKYVFRPTKKSLATSITVHRFPSLERIELICDLILDGQ